MEGLGGMGGGGGGTLDQTPSELAEGKRNDDGD